MTLSIIDGADATTENVDHLPSGLGIAVAYATGPSVAWTAGQLAAWPGALIIDQDPAASDPMADILDCEAGAATLADLAPWATRAAADYDAAARPGQRYPAVYASASGMDQVTQALADGHAPPATGLVVADWTGNRATAAAMIGTRIGGYQVVGVQYANLGAYDLDVFMAAWVNSRSVRHAPATPPGQWAGGGTWQWESAIIAGKGLDGQLHIFEYRDSAPWSKLA